MLEQPVTDARGVGVGAWAWGDVVVELEVADPEFTDQPVHCLVEVSTHVLAAEVQKIPIAFADPHSRSLQEGGVRQS